MNTEKGRNIFVDIYKILLAFFIILIHFGNPKLTNDGLSIIRLALPSFAAITGFYIFKKGTKEEKLAKAKKFLFSSVKYFLIAVIFALATQIIYALILGVEISEAFKTFLFDMAPFLHKIRPELKVGSVIYPFWYFQGLVLVAIIYYLLVKFDIEVAMFFLPLLSLPIYFVQKKWDVTQNCNYQFLYRNSIFMILPSFAGGWIAGHFKTKEFKWYTTLILIVTLALTITLQLLMGRVVQIEMTPIAVAFGSLAILLLDKLPEFNCKIFYIVFGKRFYVYIFFIHVFVGSLMAIHLNPWTQTGVFFIIVLVVSIIINQIINLSKLVLGKIKSNKQTID